MTPDEIAWRLKYGQDTLAAGRQQAATPSHWTQALAGALQMGLGGHYGANAQYETAQGKAGANKQLADLLSSGADQRTAASTMLANPWTADQGQKLAMSEMDPLTGLQRQKAQLGIDRMKADAALDPLRRQKLQMEIDQMNAGNAMMNDLFGGQQAQATVAPQVKPSVVQDGVGRFAQPALAQPEAEATIQVGSRQIPVSRAMMAAQALAKSNPTMSKFLMDQVGKLNAGATKAAELNAKTEAKNQANWPKTEQTYKALDNQMSLVDDTIKDALKNIDWSTTGFIGGMAKRIEGTQAYNLGEMLETIRANIGFDKLQAMRDASPTGGALGQVSEFENKLLQSVRGSLQQGQSPEQLKKNLMRVQKDLNDYLSDRRKRFEMDKKKYGGEQSTGLSPGVYNFNPKTGEFDAE